MLFNPSQIQTVTNRTGGNAEPKTEEVLETTYWVDSEDSIYLGLSQFSLERGRYGDPQREVVRLNAASEEISEAIVNCLRTQLLLAQDETASEYSRNKSKEFLERVEWALMGSVTPAS